MCVHVFVGPVDCPIRHPTKTGVYHPLLWRGGDCCLGDHRNSVSRILRGGQGKVKSLRKHAHAIYSDFSRLKKIDNFQLIVFTIYIFFAQNKYCGYQACAALAS